MHDLSTIFKDFKQRVTFGEPMAQHTTFELGGPADVLVKPNSVSELISILSLAREEGLPVFILGAGANLLVSDKGMRGIVISLSNWQGYEVQGTEVRAGAGLAISRLAQLTAEKGLEGLERFFRMPGSVGGSIWMNARCYESEVAESLSQVTVLNQELEVVTKRVSRADFAYKKSPFQETGEIILEAGFCLKTADPLGLKKTMEEIYEDRKAKGHFTWPSAGSVFKNNRSFGQPTGKLLDSLGLRGLKHGGAQVSPLHANIIINTGSACAKDVKELVELIERRVAEYYGLRLEREILFVGEWL